MGLWDRGNSAEGHFPPSPETRAGEFVFLLPEVLRVPCDWQFVLLLILLLEKGCVSLDSALGPAARCSCAVKEPAASLYTRSGQEID